MKGIWSPSISLAWPVNLGAWFRDILHGICHIFEHVVVDVTPQGPGHKSLCVVWLRCSRRWAWHGLGNPFSECPRVPRPCAPAVEAVTAPMIMSYRSWLHVPFACRGIRPLVRFAEVAGIEPEHGAANITPLRTIKRTASKALVRAKTSCRTFC